MDLFYAYKDGKVINAASLNQLIDLQPFTNFYDGAAVVSSLPGYSTPLRTDAYSYILPITVNGNRLDRFELDIARVGTPGDLQISLRRGVPIPGYPTATQTVLVSWAIPAEWIPTTRDPGWYVSVPLGVTITPNEQLFVCLNRVGNSTNYYNLGAANAQNTTYRTYRTTAQIGATGTYTQDNQLRYRLLTGFGGQLKNTVMGADITMLDYNADGVHRVYRFLPSVDGDGGIRAVTTLQRTSGRISAGVGGRV